MDIKKEKEFLCGFKLRERMKGKKKYQVLGSWTVRLNHQGTAGIRAARQWKEALRWLWFYRLSLSLSPFCLSEASPLHRVIEFVLWGSGKHVHLTCLFCYCFGPEVCGYFSHFLKSYVIFWTLCIYKIKLLGLVCTNF